MRRAYSNTNGNTNLYSHCNSYGDFHSFSIADNDGNLHINRYSNLHNNGHRNHHGDCYSHDDAYLLSNGDAFGNSNRYGGACADS